MRTILIAILSLSLQIILANSQLIAQSDTAQQNQTLAEQPKIEDIKLFDDSRKREIPVRFYSSDSVTKTLVAKKSKLKLAVISHGYGNKNTEYSFIADNLAANGYFVASIQHELSSDEPIPATGNVFVVRKPFWERGVQNILFVISELKKTKLDLNFKELLLVGHSNGGDMTILFAQKHPQLVRKVVSLDNRRMPFPRTKKPRILSLRSSDQVADAEVLPTEAEQEKFKVKIIKLNDTKHDEMWDGASEKQKLAMNQIISSFLKS